MKLLVIYGSSRKNGNSELLADRLVEGVKHSKLYLMDKKINPIVDMRHTDEGFSLVDDDYESIIEQVLKHDVLVFSTPVYWFGMSGQLKNFFDRWSQYLRDERFDFKQEMAKKSVFVVLVGGDNPRVEGLPLILQLQLIFKYMNMKFHSYIIGKGNRPGDILQDANALYQAQIYNQELKSMLGNSQ